jgi:CheY-like chemotaxis protein/HPt (histidine-containing phosphotransfer) domain-containing protein
MLKRLEEDGAADSGTAQPAAAERACEGLRKKVLIAEDNVVSQQAAKRFLEAIGCDVIVVEDGAAAVNACARQEFGLVLMDLQMPRMDGIQATQEIRRQERAGRHVPILALTAKSASDELARCTAAGMNGLLTKPLDIARLRQTLDRFGLARRTLEMPAPCTPAAGGLASEPVDLMTLHAKFSGDTVFVRRLCQTFVTSTSQHVEELESAVAADERARVRLLAHKVRAAGSTVYAHRLAAIAANIESEAMTAVMPALAAAVETLRRAFDEATLHIGARLQHVGC